MMMRSFWAGNVLVVAWQLGQMLSAGFDHGVGGATFSLLVALCYGLLFLLPGIILARLAWKLSVRLAVALALLWSVTVIFGLYIDQRLFALYGFHFNGFVWNLLTTPGGIASLDSSDGANVSLLVRVLSVLGGQVLWMLLCRWLSARRFGLLGGLVRWVLVVWLVALAGVQLSFGFGRIVGWRPATVTAQNIPFFIHTRVRSLAEMMHIKVERRKSYIKQGRLNYPLSPITVRDKPWSPNIIWLVSESLRADMLTPEIMPNLWKFSQSAHRFTDHYSGGNGTRMGVFSMFYSLPGNYWFTFLDAQREPVFMRILQDRNYQFGLYTSSKFTYPEFNRTVFARFPASELHAHDSEPTTWQNDIYNTRKLIGFVDQARQKNNPFFAFMFFNSPHARYQFPDYSVIRPDYLKKFNYSREDVADFKRDIVKIKNRYINSVHFLDGQLGKVFDYIAAHNLRKDTIIIITGDHAEEFMDEGRWGHNSEIHNAQIHTPMVLWIPGKGSGVHHYPTSHLDFIPTLMPLMGVTTPVNDYSEGENLLNPTSGRYRYSASWNSVACIGDKYKVILPVHNAGLSGPRVMRADDSPVSDQAKTLATLHGTIMQVLSDISRFYKKSD